VGRDREAAIAAAAASGAGIVIRGGAAKGVPTEGKQAGVQWENWRLAGLGDLLDGMSPTELTVPGLRSELQGASAETVFRDNGFSHE
jgi:hypothetical protein